MASSNVVTRGDIARALDQPAAVVGHILNTRAHIKPCGRAGICRLYDASTAVDLVRIELTAIDERRARSAVPV